MVKHKIKLEPGGKVTIPKKILQELNLKEGVEMTVELLYRRGIPYLFIYPVSQEVWDNIFPERCTHIGNKSSR